MGTNGHHPCEAIAGEQSENAGQSPNPYEANKAASADRNQALSAVVDLITITARDPQKQPIADPTHHGNHGRNSGLTQARLRGTIMLYNPH